MSKLARYTGNPLKTVFLLTLLGVFLITNSCGRAKASPSPVATAAVMKAIQDYGRDHHSLLTPGSLAKPDELDGLYSARIKNLLVQEDFAQLEKIAQQNRMEKGRLLGGVWKTFALYNGTGKPVSAGTPTDSDYAAQIARVKRWIAAYTDSPTPRISLACLYLNYSWLARGSGLANSVSESQWSLFKSRNAQAKAILLEAGTLKEKGPFWYEAMQLVAHDKAGTRPTSASYSIKPSLLNRSTATIIAGMPDTFRTSGTSSVAISWPLLRKRPIGFRNRMAQCCTSRPLARSLAIASQTSRIASDLVPYR